MKKKYGVICLIIVLLIGVIFILKDIFPFGNNSLIWSDMHDQITALYYHIWDSIHESKSLLIDFTSGGGINFFGINAYYTLSPITLILMICERNLIPEMVSIVILIKILLCGITALYFISKTFKKMPTTYQILLALLYAFSSYNLSLFIITAWMDVAYLFPLLLIGLKKLLDLKDNKIYIIVLSLSLIFCFYISFMTLIFIILVSIIYLYIYKKENIKKSIYNLGISTIISILISCVIVVPTLLSIAASQRALMDPNYIINSKLGPVIDKSLFMFSSGFAFAIITLLLKEYKKHKKFLKFFIPTTLLMLIPIVFEPINKMLHFGSYEFFPYRYGFIAIFLLIIGACYYINNVEEHQTNKKNKIITLILTFIYLIISTLIIYKFYNRIDTSINLLTFTYDKISYIALFLIFIMTFGICLFNGITNKFNKFSKIIFTVIIIFNIAVNSFIYLDNHDSTNTLKETYDTMNLLSEKELDNYYVKEENQTLIRNFGMVTNLNTYSNFTSLTNKNSFEVMQKLGYDSYWMDTESIGGNLFTDVVLANKYYLGTNPNRYYTYIDTFNNLNLYEFNKNISYGYIIKNNNINYNNSFEFSNAIYNSITSKDSIIDIYNIDDSSYKKGDIIEKSINVEGRKNIYLEIFSNLDNTEKISTYHSFKIYVNDEIILEDYPSIEKNGVIDLGSLEGIINIKIEILRDVEVNNIDIGVLDLNLLDSFIDENFIDTKVIFNKNKINIEVNGNEGDILYLPINYLEGYKSDYEIIKVFDNFIGIKLHDGLNNIKITYIPPGLIIGSILSIIGIILMFLWLKFKPQFKLLTNIFFIAYIALLSIVILVMYVIPLIMFLISFIL